MMTKKKYNMHSLPLLDLYELNNEEIIDMSLLKKALKIIIDEKIKCNLIGKILNLFIEFTQSERGVLILKRNNNNFLVEAESSTKKDNLISFQSIPIELYSNISLPVINYVLNKKEYIIINNAQKPNSQIIQLYLDPYIKNNRIHSILCFPIKHNQEIRGLLYFENNQIWHVFSRKLIGTINLISLLITSILDLIKNATTDYLTGLYNYSYFDNRLENEIIISQRYGKIFSLIMIDIDNFKKINDKFGHQVGNIVLQKISSTIKKTCRKSDVIARYGGEEIIIILPETNSDDALNLAEKIRKKIELLEIEFNHMNDQKLQVTVSLGVSCYPAHAHDKKNLIKATDEALYYSKNNGKNQITLFTKDFFYK